MSNQRSSTQYQPGDLLTKMECCSLFCDELRISRDSYYKYYRSWIKFKSYAQNIGPEGKVEQKLQRIPYEVAQGLINRLCERPGPGDPPDEVLEEFTNYSDVKSHR